MDLTPARLSRTIDSAFAKTKTQRQARVRFLSQFVGRFYRSASKRGDESSKASPINLLYSALTTLVPNLVFNDPKAKAVVDLLAYRTYAELLGTATTMVGKRTKFRETLRGVITDSILMAGFIKTGIAIGDQVIEFDDKTTVNLTEPFIERVSPDDMILDPNARSWDEQAIVGNKFRADIDHLIEIGYGDPDQLRKLGEDVGYNAAVNKAEDVTKVTQQSDETRRYVELAEIWIPAEKRVVTMPYKAGATFDDFVHEIEYSGPAKGQYHMLGLVTATDNLLPVAPAGLYYDLHILGNRIARKIARQAERNKRVLAYEDDAEEDVEAIADSNDGESVRVNDVNKLKEIEYGGVSEKAYEWMNWIKQTFSEQSGSIENTGQGPESPTLGQAQMVQANQSVRLGDMQNIVYGFAGEVLSDIAFYLHTDPLIDLPLVRRVNGTETQEFYTPDARQGEWFDYHITIQPLSMARPDPNTAVARKIQFATNVIPAAAQAAGMLGPGFKIGPFLTTIAREVGIDDADEWLNTPEIAQWIQMNMVLSQKTGDPGKANNFVDPNMAGMMMGGMAPQLPGAPGVNPSQPNPSAMGPDGGIMPGTEAAIAAQQAAKPNQASVKALAMTRRGV